MILSSNSILPTLLPILFLLLPYSHSFDAEAMEEFFKHTGASGTQHGKSEDDPEFYESNSGIPHLPTLSGFMGTHGTYRFLTIHEQTAVLIGDGKHGVWRVQENGFIREYRKRGKEGLRQGVDPNNLDTSFSTHRILLKIIKDNYASYIPDEGWSGYKYPDQRISDGKYDNMKGYLNFIDLSIYHPKYKGKYNNHVPIDLPHFYCTMTQNDYKYMKDVWRYAVAQPRANKLGPLAVRAGMDIKENYFNVLRFDFFNDAGVWSNVGTKDNHTNRIVKNLKELRERYQTVNYQRLDRSRVDVEAYLFERPFFNKPYIFITFVMDTKPEYPSDYSYVRPHGAYFEGLVARGRTVKNTVVVHYPRTYVENYPVKGKSSQQIAYGLPTFGHHHPKRHAHKLNGGACPNRGGDWGRYPWGNSGAGFPTNYEEVTPICDGFVMDMKMWTNLQAESWNDIHLFLGNAGSEGQIMIRYQSDANIYGRYSDPYLVNRDIANPYEMDMTDTGKIIGPKDPKPPRVWFRLNFTRPGSYLTYNKVKLRGGTSDEAKKVSSAKKADSPPRNVFGGAPKQAGVDAGYIIICCFIVFTMQTGFALLESGFCSPRSEANIMAKNMLDVSLGGIAYWFVGYGFSWGNNTKPSKAMSGESFFLVNVDINSDDAATYIWYIFHCSFATATATITSGGVAERIKLHSYLIFAVIDTAFIYTFCCHWVWHPDGFLYPYVLDFSGSSVVHMCGGASALAGMLVLGPRLGRFEMGNERLFAMGNPTNVVLGTFMLWWGWIGFNSGAQMIISGESWRLVARIAVVTVNSAMAGAFASVVYGLIASRWRPYLLDIGELCACLLGALVAICAPCANIRPWEALVIGFIAGFVTLGFERLIKKLKIDDPVGCFAVHWGAGLWGLIAAAFFADHPDPNLSGIFRKGNGAVLGWNILCGIIITVWSFGVSFIVFITLKFTIGLRISEEEEKLGLDRVDHNILHQSYDCYMIEYNRLIRRKTTRNTPTETQPPTKGDTLGGRAGSYAPRSEVESSSGVAGKRNPAMDMEMEENTGEASPRNTYVFKFI